MRNGIQSYLLSLGMVDIYECKCVTKSEMESPSPLLENASSTKKFLQISVLNEQNTKAIYFQIDYDVEVVSQNINEWMLQYQRDVLQDAVSTIEDTSISDTIPTQLLIPSSPPKIITHTRQPSDFVPPRLKSSSDIIADDDVTHLCMYLPRRYTTTDWNLLYSPQKHGYSINTFYSKLKDKGPTILMIRDTNQFVFGAFLSESWKSDNQGYYGTGETFLFKLKPDFAVYKWSQLNSYFILSSLQSLSVGGGGTYGLWIDKDFLDGSSSDCSTFLNPVISSTSLFKISTLEVWGF